MTENMCIQINHVVHVSSVSFFAFHIIVHEEILDKYNVYVMYVCCKLLLLF